MTKIPFGPKHAEIAAKWIPSLATFGATAGLTGLYLTDWKLICQFIPFYGGKYSEEK